MSKLMAMQFFSLAAAQAAFDGDGNAEAAFNRLKADADKIPEARWIVRPTFESGAEQEDQFLSTMTEEAKADYFRKKALAGSTAEPVAVSENAAVVSGGEAAGTAEGSGDGGAAPAAPTGDAPEMKTPAEMAATFAPTPTP